MIMFIHRYQWQQRESEPTSWIYQSVTLLQGNPTKMKLNVDVLRVSWVLPPSSRLKLNVDASFNAQGTGGGSVLRDDSGEIIYEFAFPILGATSPVHAEAMALVQSLDFCSTTAQHPLEAEIDSKNVVDYLSGTNATPWNFWNFVDSILTHQRNFNATITHVYREANSVADSLASFGSNISSLASFNSLNSLPLRIHFLCLCDVRGLPVVRFR